jgi:uncharacterized protein (TIGR02569 family)
VIGADALSSPLPSSTVLRAFGAEGEIARIVDGGQGMTVRAGGLAFKRCENSELAEWLAGVIECVQEDGFRVARPVRGNCGKFVVDGWCATRWLEGTTAINGRWHEAMAACSAFHNAIRHVPYSPALASLDNPYTRVDSGLWQTTPIVDARLGPMAEQLRRFLRPVALPGQLVHGDPGEGNMLFCIGEPVGIIDMVPYWHPANYSLAMLLSDGIAWSGAPLELLESVRELPEMDQLLARAVLFRLHVGYLFGGAVRAARRAERYAPVAEAIARWQSK